MSGSSILSINSNISSLKAQRSLADTTNSLSSTYEKLSSGLRINKASDDAAGLAISSALKADTRIYTQAVRNLSDGMSYLAIGEGALKQLTEITTRQIELAEQSANGVYSLQQRRAINTEANALADEYNRIVASTSFNGRNILDPTQNSGNLVLQGGYGTDGSLQLDVGEEFSRTVGDGTFGVGVSYLMNSSSLGALVNADLNGDGKLDLISAGAGGGAYIRLGNGDGTFGSARSYATEWSFSNDLSVTDLNGDGKYDLITAGTRVGTGGFVSVRLGNGDGTFGSMVSYQMNDEGCSAIAIQDINNDGKLDVVTSGSDGDSVNIRLGNGNGTFASVLSYAAAATWFLGVSLNDLNGDGNLDIAVAGQASSGGVFLWFGNGDGTFTTGSTYPMESIRSYDIATEDINQDGICDIIVVGDDGGAGYVDMRLGNGDGTFKSVLSYRSEGRYSKGLSVVDMNGDGLKDLVSTGEYNSQGYTTIRLGNGDGTFKSALSYMLDSTISNDLSIGDFDGNGSLDIVAGGSFGGAGCATVKLGTGVQVSSMPKLDLLTQANARSSLDFLKGQLDRITSELGSFGAFQSRISVASNVLQVSRENYLSANSRIEDADIAVEGAQLVKQQILQQAASSVLAQANLGPQLALKLLS